MFYYNQNDYSKIPYPYKNNGKTIATSGCGVVSACIVFNNLIGKELYSVKKMAEFSLSQGARGSNGTDMIILLNALCKKHKEFSYTTTGDEDKLIAHLKKGGMAIANQGDAYNVFSSAGHYVVAYKMVGSDIEVIDPQMYAGKYDSYDRPKRIVKKTINGCIVSKKEIAKATADRYDKAYYLITHKKPEPKAPTVKLGTYKLTNVRGIYKGCGANTGRKLVKDLSANAKLFTTSSKNNAEAFLMADTKVTLLETKKASSGNLWARIPSGWIVIWEKDKNKLFIK